MQWRQDASLKCPAPLLLFSAIKRIHVSIHVDRIAMFTIGRTSHRSNVAHVWFQLACNGGFGTLL